MSIEEFKLERTQSLWENRVRYNLTESGVHPHTLRELLSREECEALLDLRLGYGQTNGADALRAAIAALYPGCGGDNVLVTAGSAEATSSRSGACWSPATSWCSCFPTTCRSGGWRAPSASP